MIKGSPRFLSGLHSFRVNWNTPLFFFKILIMKTTTPGKKKVPVPVSEKEDLLFSIWLNIETKLNNRTILRMRPSTIVKNGLLTFLLDLEALSN